MNEFYNNLILRDEEYENGLFSKVPDYKKQGSAYILTEGINDNILVDEYTTTRDIRRGKYRRLVEISTRPYMEEIRFESASREMSFTFDIYVKAVIQVKDPIVFYNNKNLDVTSYFKNMFSLDVRKITRKYSILDYKDMDEELTVKLSSYNNVDASTGFEYRISIVDAEPGSGSKEYVSRNSRQILDAELRDNARGLRGTVSKDYKEAVQTEVIEGKLSEEEAIIKIREFERSDFKDKKEWISELRKEGLISDANARDMIQKLLSVGGPGRLTGESTDRSRNRDAEGDIILDELYEEEQD